MNSLNFEGKGLAFFKIHFVNVILSILSLSILYPWAKVREIKYLCSNSSLAEQPFTFTGTTEKFFKGYIKTLIIFLCVGLLCIAGGFLAAFYKSSILSTLIFTMTLILCMAIACFFYPIILHGSLNYRFNNTLWGNVRPTYTGKLGELVPIYFTGLVLTTLTAGIYSAWYQVKLAKYLLPNFHFGSLKFDFSGEAKTLFFILLKGFLLTLITFGIYGIWFTKELYEYFVNNIVVKKDDQEFQLHSDANTLEVFEMMVGNFLLVFLTLGIGASWAYIRYYKFIINHCVIPVDFNFSSISETVEDEKAKEPAQKWLDKWNPVLIA
jgi:uncharacterized membrane protein YjgN (DUF898 family)